MMLRTDRTARSDDPVYVVRVECRADGSPSSHDGRYVVAWNPHTMAGKLDLTSTSDLARARRFTQAEAFTEWKTVSRVQPHRLDGEANKPLCGITISIIREDCA